MGALVSINDSTAAVSPHAAALLEEYRRRRGEPAYLLACQASLPLSLSADLLHSLRSCFATDEQQQDLGIPWIAVADLLLSPLCRPIGHDPDAAVLFELLPEVRIALLAELKQHPRLGQMRMRRLGEFLTDYAEYRLSRAPSGWLENQRTVALAYVDPAGVACELAKRLRRLVYSATNPSPSAEQVTWRARLHHMDQLIESLADPLGEQHADLPRYARGMRLHLDGLTDAAATYLASYSDRPSLTVAGVELPLLPKEVPNEESATTTEDAERLRRALEPVPFSLRGALRKQIISLFPDTESLRAFILDCYPFVHYQIGHLISHHPSGTTNTRTISALNFLLEQEESEDILAKLIDKFADPWGEDRIITEAQIKSVQTLLLIERKMPTKAEFQPNKTLLERIAHIKPQVVRQVLRKLLKSQAELRAYILDYFHGISQNLSSSMNGAQLHNILFRYDDPLVIIKTLCSHLESDAPLEMAIEIQEHIDSLINTTQSKATALEPKFHSKDALKDTILRITRVSSILEGYLDDHFPKLKNIGPDPKNRYLHAELEHLVQVEDVDVIFRTLSQSFPETTDRVLDLLQSEPTDPRLANHIRELRHLMRTLLRDWQSFESFCELALADCFWLLPMISDRSSSETIILEYYSAHELAKKLQSAFTDTDIMIQIEKIAQQVPASQDSPFTPHETGTDAYSFTVIHAVSKKLRPRQLRKMLDACLVTIDEFHAFLLDYFPQVYFGLSSAMDRTSQITRLMEKEDVNTILRFLYESKPHYVEKFIHETLPSLELVE